jgi:tetratricopeptide (TPR) repeat protein
MEQEKYAEAIELYRDFLARIEGHPWLKWLVFFTYGVYTFRIEAVVHTEIARAHLYIGELNEAGKQLHIALEYDTRYAVAFYYLAVLEVLKHNVPDAEKHFTKARQNGYPKVTFQEFLELVHEEFK